MIINATRKLCRTLAVHSSWQGAHLFLKLQASKCLPAIAQAGWLACQQAGSEDRLMGERTPPEVANLQVQTPASKETSGFSIFILNRALIVISGSSPPTEIATASSQQRRANNTPLVAARRRHEAQRSGLSWWRATVPAVGIRGEQPGGAQLCGETV